MKPLLFLSLFLISPLYAAKSKHIDGSPLSDADKSAINQNFDELDRQFLNVKNLTMLGYKVGTFTSKGSTGNQSVTGVGFKPRLVQFQVFIDLAGDTQFTAGAMTSASQYGGGIYSKFSATTGFGSTSATDCLIVSNGVGSYSLRAQFVSFDTDGFTINWSLHGATAQSINYVAFQ